jgi:hypothetical protein
MSGYTVRLSPSKTAAPYNRRPFLASASNMGRTDSVEDAFGLN